MKKSYLLLICLLLLIPFSLFAGYDRIIKVGDVSYGCMEIEEPASSHMITEEYCQFPDPSGGDCFFISMIYLFNGKTCEESCQHFNSEEKKCMFKASCKVKSGYFCRNACLVFDDKANICKTTKTECY